LIKEEKHYTTVLLESATQVSFPLQDIVLLYTYWPVQSWSYTYL